MFSKGLDLFIKIKVFGKVLIIKFCFLRVKFLYINNNNSNYWIEYLIFLFFF